MPGDLLLFVLILTGVAVVAIFLNKRLLTLLLSSVFLLLVAMRLNIPNMYLMGTVLLALPVASYAIAFLGSRHLDVTRSAPETAFEGQAVPVQVDVYSPLALFSGFVRMSKHLPRHVRMVAGSETMTPIGGGMRHEYLVRPERRGVYRLAGCTISLHDPLGIFLLNRRFPLTSSIVVYPTALPLEDTRALGESSGGWLIQTTRQRRGEEDDIYGTREYRVGDDLRRIHWRSSARQGNLVVVEREQGSSGRIWIALDVLAGSQRGTDRDPSLERAVKLAVTIMEAALQRGDAVGLLAPSPSGATIAPGAGESQRWRLLDALARVQADGETTLMDAVLNEDIEAGSSVVLITAAPTQEMLKAIPGLLDMGVGVVAAPVSSPTIGREPNYPTITGYDFADAVEAMGAAALHPPLPEFAPSAHGARAAAHGSADRGPAVDMGVV